jgi:opacity protein-like surface antigen
MKFLLLISLLSLFSLNAFSEQYPPMKDEYKNIEDMITKLEKDVQPADTKSTDTKPAAAKVESATVTQAPAPVAATVPEATPAPVAKVKAKAKPVTVAQAPAPAPEATPAPIITPETQSNKVLPQHDEVRSYIDERPGKRYNKQLKIREGLSGPSVFTPSTRNPSLDSEDVYHYSFMPPTSNEGYNEEGIYDGKFGHFVITVFGDYTLYYKGTTNRNTWGSDIQLGWQFPLEPFAIAIILDGAVRGSNTAGTNVFGIGPRVRASVRVNTWIFPYLEGGLEFAKLESMNRWVYPYTVVGGGVMFRFGKADRKSEFSLHKDYDVAQVLLIVGGDILTSPELNATTPDNAVVKFGISVEFF